MARTEPEEALARPHEPDVELVAEEPATARLVRLFLSRRKRTTLVAYAADLDAFRRYLGVSTAADAVEELLTGGHGAANALVLEYRAALQDQAAHGSEAHVLSSATVNRRLAAVRSLVSLARLVGLVDWRLDVENIPTSGYRDTRGPTTGAVQAMLATASARHDAKGCRDFALLRLLHDLGLRRQEVTSLDLVDLDLEVRTVSVVGKGRDDPEKLTLPESTAAAIASWVAVRGSEPGPLFTSFDRPRKGRSRRLSGDGLYRVVRSLGEKAVRRRVRPHGLRHAAITAALDVTNGDLRRAQRFSRHRDPRTLLRYDDNRRDLGGEVAVLVAATVE